MVSILLNIAIAIISVLAWLSVVQGHGDDRNLMAHGLRSLKYYTVLSNLFSGLISALYAADMLLSHGSPDSWIFVLKLAAASVVMVTFLTVMLFLGPTMGWEYMFKAGNFWLHLALPLAAAADVCLFVPVGALPFLATLAPVVFTAAYGVFYLGRILLYGRERDGVVYDFYGFLRTGEDKAAVVVVVMLTGTWLIAIALWFVSRLIGLA